MQVHPPRSHTFNSSGYTSSSLSSVTTSAYSAHSSNPALTPSTTRISSRWRGRVYTHPDPIDEGFFSQSSSPFIAPSSSTMCETSTATASPTFSSPQLSTREKGSGLHHIHASQAKAKIKPLFKFATGNARTSRNSLDLSQPGGGEAARGLGLGIYGSEDYMYGYDEMDPVSRHRRTVSSTSSAFSGGYDRNGQYIHPRRQVPRPYTPNQSCQGSDDHDSSDEEGELHSRGYYSGEYSRSNSIDFARRGSTPLRIRTDSALSSPILLRNATAVTSSHSPISPITTTHTTVNLLRPSARHHTKSGATTREPSPSFAASVTAARLAWDAKEAHKEEKREKKRRKSEQREREKEEKRTSKDISREDSRPSVWTEAQGEKVEYHHTPEPRVNGGTGKRWGATGAGAAWVPPKPKGPGLKKRWLGFVVWIRISLVKMSRTFGGSKKTKS